MKIRQAFFAAGLLCVANSCLAEGNCPAGMFPITSPGVLGCAPIAVAPAAPVSHPRWSSRWGAVASDEAASGVHGVATGQASQFAAEVLARQRCTAGGGQACSTFTVYANTCIFIAGPPPDPSATVRVNLVAVAGDAAGGARRIALERCARENARSCIVAYTDCVQPVLLEG